jgi:hypothetical protein
MSGGAQRAPDEPREANAPGSRNVGSAGEPAASWRTPDPDSRERDFENLLPAAAVACRLRLTPADAMSSAVLTGLGMLAREGRIRLDVEIAPEAPPLGHGPWHLRDKQRPQTILELDGGGSAVIDSHDSWEIQTQDLLRHDLYFKRSLRPESVWMPRGERLRALGLLNEVRADFIDVAELRSELGAARSAPQRLRIFLRWAAWCGAARVGLGGRPNWSRMYAPPTPGQSQRVLLMAGLWDPAQVPAAEAAQRADRDAVNRQRVECIRALRRAFGARFHGGVRPGEFARRYAPDVMLGSEREASRREFLRRVREHAVCVTSHGLNGSNGFRLAEYVAFSRAIVCEPLRYALPGAFAPGTHYLEYTTPEECVARVAWLFDRPDWRDEMARRNWEWYSSWQRPDRLALRLVALTWAAGQGQRRTGGSPDERASAGQELPSASRAASS